MRSSILIVGSGGREHALSWKIRKDNNDKSIFVAPGNGGTYQNIDIQVNDFKKLAELAVKEECITIVGPEEPIAKGIANYFNEKEIPILAPTKEAAMLETSKSFAKNLMKNNNIKTADYEVFDEADKAFDFVNKKEGPIVIKTDGLAAGKGVIICKNIDESKIALNRISNNREFGDSGNRIVIEEYLEGYEISCIGLSDGKNFISLGMCQDHKTIFDNNLGANTGGMGSYCPVPMISKELEDKIINQIMLKVIQSMRTKGSEYLGILYAGLMIIDNEPHVLEFNCRFGDPETQSTMMRLKSDIMPYIEAAINKELDSVEPIIWNKGSAACVIMSSKGYPQKYEKGKIVTGINEIKNEQNTTIFHSGTAINNNEIITTGGRVLGVTSIGNNINEATNRSYEAIKMINFEGAHFRKDIAKMAKDFIG